MILALLLVLAADASAPAAAPAAAPPAAAGAVVVDSKPRILVLDFRDDGIGPNAVRVIHDTLVSHLAKNAKLDVLSSEDVRRAVQREAERREATNCDEEGCIAEIAEALGAQLTIFGTAGKLGDLVVVNVNLYDSRAARSVGRETIEVGSLEELPGPLRRAGDKLTAQLLGEPVDDAPALGPMFWTGAVVGGAGLVTAIVGASIYGANGNAVDEAASFTDKTNAKYAQDGGLNTFVAGAAVLAIGAITSGVAFLIE